MNSVSSIEAGIILRARGSRSKAPLSRSSNAAVEPIMLQAARILAWLLASAIVVLSIVPPWLRPETGAPHDLEHFAIFAATGFAFGLSYGRRYGVVALRLVIFSGAIELAQLFAPGRHARLSDFIVDASAAGIGLAAALVFPTHSLVPRGRI